MRTIPDMCTESPASGMKVKGYPRFKADGGGYMATLDLVAEIAVGEDAAPWQLTGRLAPYKEVMQAALAGDDYTAVIFKPDAYGTLTIEGESLEGARVAQVRLVCDEARPRAEYRVLVRCEAAVDVWQLLGFGDLEVAVAWAPVQLDLAA